MERRKTGERKNENIILEQKLTKTRIKICDKTLRAEIRKTQKLFQTQIEHSNSCNEKFWKQNL